jgi:hypothetical protein
MTRQDPQDRAMPRTDVRGIALLGESALAKWSVGVWGWIRVGRARC